ncbi:MAG: hypothetical protein PVF49_09670 [Anaerolineales bacterium]|jgi:hypothetical protein
MMNDYDDEILREYDDETLRAIEQHPEKNWITNCLHCSHCVREKLRPDLEIGYKEVGLQLRCRNHDINLIHWDFAGEKLGAWVGDDQSHEVTQ